MKQLFRYLAPFKKDMPPMLTLYALQSVCSLFMPYLMSYILENGVRTADMRVVWIGGGVMLAVTVLNVFFAFLSNKISCNIMARFTADIRRQVFEKVNKLSFEQFSSIGTGSLITRTTDDISWLEETITQIPLVFVSVPIMFIGGVVLTFVKDWLLALILIAVSPVVLFAVSRITKNMEARWDKADRYIDVQNRIVRERLSGVRVIRAFDKDEEEHVRTENATRIMSQSFVKNNTLSGFIQPLASLLLNVVSVAVIYIGALRMENSAFLKAGDIIAIIQYITIISNAVVMLSWTFGFMPHVKVSLRRVSEIIDMPTEEEGSAEKVRLSGDIRFEKVSFAYDKAAADAVSDIDLDIKEGEIVGIIGGTGSGKTTVAKLILDFYKNVSGKRYIGGVSFDDLSPKQVRDNVSVALQKSMIFEGTLEENIKMGNRDATKEQLERATEIAQMKKYVESHEEGYDYKLQHAGSNISGGQKQRINIARAILKEAQVYIFDDSFSALDFLTESRLRKALNRYLQGKTQIIVTQRAATAMRCDKVYVMDKGRIVGVGDHARLLRDCPVYREIYDSQLGGDHVIG